MCRYAPSNPTAHLLHESEADAIAEVIYWQLYLDSFCLHLGMAPLVIGVYGMIGGVGGLSDPAAVLGE